MSALFRKEFRALMPVWITTLLVAVLPMWVYAIGWRTFSRPAANELANVYMRWDTANGVFSLANFTFGLGVLVLALVPFGHELTAKTFNLLLSQPISRRAIWSAKALTMAMAMAINILVYAVSLWLLLRCYFAIGPLTFAARYRNELITAVWLAFLAYAGGLWTMLLLRTIVGAFAITIIVPLAIVGTVFGVVDKVAPNSVDTPRTYGLVFSALLLYGIVGILFARWQLLRAQDTHWTGGPIIFPRLRFKATTLRTSPSNPWWALFRKEVQLQQAALVISAVLFVLHLGSFLFRGSSTGQTSTTAEEIATGLPAVWVLLPLLIGSTAVAEERRLGTLETLLTQPISRRTQLLIKVLGAAVLAVLCGAIIPVTLETIAGSMGLSTMFRGDEHEAQFLVMTTVSLIVVGLAFLNSSMGRNSMEAVCLTIASAPIAMGLLAMLLQGGGLGIPSCALLTPYICAVCLVPTVIAVVWKNFQNVQIRWGIIFRTWIVIALSGATAWGASSFVWNRAWEFVVPMEPKHGSAKMHIGDGAKIISTMHGAMVLLPDHRLWLVHVKLEVVHDKERPKEDHVVGAHLERSRFLAGAWQDIGEAAGHAPYGIKTDGTLWEFRPVKTDAYLNGLRAFEADTPRQVGTDTDWAALAGGISYMLALKRDGSLWGWTAEGQSHGNVHSYVQTDYVFRRIWPGVKWSKVFAGDDACLGIKEDGTVWKWSALNEVLKRGKFPGTNWTSFGDNFGLSLATRDDGTLWSYANTEARANGNFYRHSKVFGDTVDTGPGVHRVGDSTNWNFITAFYPLCALKANGTWLIHDGHVLRESRKEGIPISSYSDWIAIDSKYAYIMGLAADGTVSCWMSTDPYPYYTSRTRAPTWSANVFTTPDQIMTTGSASENR